MKVVLMVATGWLSVALSAQTTFSPARYQRGAIPIVPVVSAGVGGGQVLLEVSVGSTGEVLAITPLRTTASFTELTVGAVQAWRFVPAEERVAPAPGPIKLTVRRVASKVLVAAVFRPPTLSSPTLGEPVQDVAAGSGETPFPLSLVTPPFPPAARDPGVALVEAEVGVTGAVMSVRVLRSAPPFDGPARDAARQWTFRPARIARRPVRSFAYILFGFPRPVV